MYCHYDSIEYLPHSAAWSEIWGTVYECENLYFVIISDYKQISWNFSNFIAILFRDHLRPSYKFAFTKSFLFLAVIFHLWVLSVTNLSIHFSIVYWFISQLIYWFIDLLIHLFLQLKQRTMYRYRAPFASKAWIDKFKHVIGIIHTNYLIYTRGYSGGVFKEPLLYYLNQGMCRANCHKIIKLSGMVWYYVLHYGMIWCDIIYYDVILYITS